MKQHVSCCMSEKGLTNMELQIWLFVFYKINHFLKIWQHGQNKWYDFSFFYFHCSYMQFCCYITSLSCNQHWFILLYPQCSFIYFGKTEQIYKSWETADEAQPILNQRTGWVIWGHTHTQSKQLVCIRAIRNHHTERQTASARGAADRQLDHITSAVRSTVSLYVWASSSAAAEHQSASKVWQLNICHSQDT